SGKARWRPADEIHLVHRQRHVADTEHRGDATVAFGLRQYPLTGVDQKYGRLGSRCASRHVAGVLLMTRRIGHNKAPSRCSKETGGDIGRDALLALCLTAV